MPSSVPGDVQVATYVPKPLADWIDAAAQAQGLSRSAWVRTVLVDRTRAAQGLPATVTDASAIDRVAAILEPKGGDDDLAA